MVREAEFKRLVRLVARLFYSEGFPPAEEPEPEEAGKPKRKIATGPTLGLGVIVLDALTRREWVQEDYVPKPHSEGEAKDSKAPGLAQQLRLNPKLLRQALRMFERDELMVRREHRKEKAVRRRRPGDVIPDAAATAMLGGTEVADENADGAPKQHTHSYCCLDYPTIVDVVQLKLHMMKRALKEADDDAAPVAAYCCPACDATFTSMDAMRMLDDDGDFICDECGTAVEQKLEGGALGGNKERQLRKAATRKLIKTFEQATKPVQDLLSTLSGVKPPDYGSLQDWQLAKQHAAVLQQRRAAKGNSSATPTALNVELDMGGVAEEAPQPVAAKLQPAWMQRDGVISRGGLDAADAEAAAEAARLEAATDAAQRARAQEWQREQVRLEAARNGTKEIIGTDDQEPAAKRGKHSGGWSLVEDVAVKEEPDVEVKTEPKIEVKTEINPVEVKREEAAALPDDDDDEDWEDV